MMPLPVAIVDDEPLAIERLSRAIAEISGLQICGTAVDGPSAAALVDAERPAVIFLDIQMPGFTGLELARRLRSQGPIVIFTTAYRSHAVDAFDLDATDYLLKPIAFDRVRTAIDRARVTLLARKSLTNADRSDIWVKDRGFAFRLSLNEVERFEADRDYVKICTDQRHWLIRDSLNSLERQLNENRFFRLHRSTLVSAAHVSCVLRERDGTASVVLRSGHQCRVGRQYRHNLKRLTS